jgi:hypothetical protein
VSVSTPHPTPKIDPNFVEFAFRNQLIFVSNRSNGFSFQVCERAVVTLVTLLLSGDIATCRQATCAVANLVENSELHDR